MERLCPACGARISDEMKICGNCGKIIPPKKRNMNGQGRKPAQQSQRARPQQPRTNSNSKPMMTSAQTAQQKTRQYQRPQPVAHNERQGYQTNRPAANNQQVRNRQKQNVPPVNRQKSSVQKRSASANRKGNTRFNKQTIKKYIKIAVVVLVIYAVISAVQIFRVRFSTYEFTTTDMKMSQDNYGQAVDNFFDNGHWIYNPFTFTVKYKGEAEGKDYTLKFSSLSSVKLKEITVDGEEKTGKKIEPVIMGMFI